MLAHILVFYLPLRHKLTDNDPYLRRKEVSLFGREDAGRGVVDVAWIIWLCQISVKFSFFGLIRCDKGKY